MENFGDGTPRSPTHKKVTHNKESTMKLKQLLYGRKLKDLPIDFIETIYFSDVYLLDDVLGSGSFGVALKVLEKDTGEEYAMKVKKILNLDDFKE